MDFFFYIKYNFSSFFGKSNTHCRCFLRPCVHEWCGRHVPCNTSNSSNPWAQESRIISCNSLKVLKAGSITSAAKRVGRNFCANNSSKSRDSKWISKHALKTEKGTITNQLGRTVDIRTHYHCKADSGRTTHKSRYIDQNTWPFMCGAGTRNANFCNELKM